VEYVPPVIVAVDVNVPLIVAPAMVGVLTVGDVRVLEARVCAPPVPTISPVTPCADVPASCVRKSEKSKAETPCSTVAPTECDLELVPSTPRVTVYAVPTRAVTVTISSLAVSFSRISVNGYCDGKPVAAASDKLVLVVLASTALDSVVLAAVEL
jgi:hypothetical protein